MASKELRDEATACHAGAGFITMRGSRGRHPPREAIFFQSENAVKFFYNPDSRLQRFY